MSEVKKHITYAEQIEKLRSRGCIICDDAVCKTVLENTGYGSVRTRTKTIENTTFFTAWTHGFLNNLRRNCHDKFHRRVLLRQY